MTKTVLFVLLGLLCLEFSSPATHSLRFRSLDDTSTTVDHSELEDEAPGLSISGDINTKPQEVLEPVYPAKGKNAAKSHSLLGEHQYVTVRVALYAIHNIPGDLLPKNVKTSDLVVRILAGDQVLGQGPVHETQATNWQLRLRKHHAKKMTVGVYTPRVDELTGKEHKDFFGSASLQIPMPEGNVTLSENPKAVVNETIRSVPRKEYILKNVDGGEVGAVELAIQTELDDNTKILTPAERSEVESNTRATSFEECSEGKGAKCAQNPISLEFSYNNKASMQWSCLNDCSTRGVCVEGHCECAVGFDGLDCGHRMNMTTCPHDCYGRGTCEKGKCRCHPKYGGLDCSAEKTLSTCENDCMDRGHCNKNSICECQKGWTGGDCSVSTEHLQKSGNGGDCPLGRNEAGESEACAGHGLCKDDKCHCTPKWEGIDCAEEVYKSTSCPEDCSGHGHCEAGKCICHPWYMARDCSQLKMFTKCKNDCNGHGICPNGKCYCHPRYTGEDCSTTIDVCPDNCNAASGNGLCVQNTCKCSKGYTGVSCADLDPCATGCSGHGICRENRCICNKNWKSDSCSEPNYPGTGCPNDCSGNGVCVDGKCVCRSGFSGDKCDKTSCVNDCSNSGRCVEGVCHCNPNSFGPDCSQGAPRCPELCVPPTGECTSNGLCVCAPGYTGEACQHSFKLPSCPDGCSGHGLCNTKTNLCECDKGWVGSGCSTQEAEAVFTVSETHYKMGERIKVSWAAGLIPHEDNTWVGIFRSGECSIAGSSTYNQCYIYFSKVGKEETAGNIQICGRETMILPGKYEARFMTGSNNRLLAKSTPFEVVASTSCKNDCMGRGACNNGTCECSPSYKGEFCEVLNSLTECPGDCSLHGVCENGKCVCHPDWEGDLCNRLSTKEFPEESKLNAPCVKLSFCNGAGVCMDDKCKCNPHFIGAECEQSAHRSAVMAACPGVCSMRGNCDDKGTCTCHPWYTGPTCREVSPDFVC